MLLNTLHDAVHYYWWLAQLAICSYGRGSISSLVDWSTEDTFMVEFFSLVAAASVAEGTGCKGEQEMSVA